jgi:FHA domain
MDILRELIDIVRVCDLQSFVKTYPTPFLLRYLTQEELDQVAKESAEEMFDDQGTQRGRSPEIEMTDRFESYKPVLRSEATTLARLSEPIQRFSCYPIIKTNRNIFPYGPTIGRTRNNDIIVPLPVVSKFHSWVQKNNDGSWYAYDARSRFGTFVDGIAVPPEGDQGRALRPGGTLRLGDISLLFVEPASVYSWVSLKLKTMNTGSF